MPYGPEQNGNAHYRSWMHLPENTTLVEGLSATPFEDRKYAQLVYLVGATSSSPVVTDDSSLAVIIEVDGDDTYIAEAIPGSLLASSVWRCKKVEVSGNTTKIIWADGNANFDNPADDLTNLSYS